MDADLRAKFHAAAAQPDGEADLDDVRHRTHRLRRRRIGARVAAVVVLLLVPIGAIVRGELPLDVAFAPDGEGTVEGAWSPMSSAPVDGRVGAAVVFTGDEVLVWGGRPRADGAAYDPVDDQWRPLPPAPIGARDSHVGAWTGTEFLVWGGVVYDPPEDAEQPVAPSEGGAAVNGAAYDPADDRWRQLPDAPIAPGQTVGVWTGQELAVFGDTAAAAYDPAANTWRELSAPPRNLGRPSVVFTDEEVVFWGAGQGTGFAYHPGEDAWRGIPDPPVPQEGGYRLVWTGSEVVLVGGYARDAGGATEPATEVAAYDPETDTWRRLADLPRGERYGLEAVWTGGQILAVGGGLDPDDEQPVGAWRYVPELEQWDSLPRPPLTGRDRPVTVWAQDRLVVWSGAAVAVGDEAATHDDGAVWQFAASPLPDRESPPAPIADFRGRP